MTKAELEKKVAGLEATIKKLQSKVADATKSSSTEGFKLGGGFFDLIKEGGELYDLRKDSFKNTGLLLDELSGPGGFISKFAKLAESDVSIFGSIRPTIQAFEDLGKATTSFAMTSGDMQDKLGNTLAVFKELGVDVQDFSAVLDSARLGFKMGAADADKLAMSVGNIGLATGVGMGKAMKNFNAAQSSMAYSTSKLMENFRQLQFTAGTTGVGFEKLTSAFGDSMDTFEGSASKAGNLNAILGRSVFNSIDLLGKTEGERVSTIVKGIRESVNVEALKNNKFQLKAVAEGLGLSVDDTRKLLTGQTSVDAALASKTSKDPREKAISKMAELLRDNTNPAIEDFVTVLKKSRTELANTGAEFNAKQRKFFRDMLANENITANTPAELFTYVEGAVDSLKSVSIEGIRNLKEEFAVLGANLLSPPKGTERTEALKAIIDRLAIVRRNDKTNKALTPSAKAKAAAGVRISNQEVAATINDRAYQLASEAGKAISVMLDGALKLKVGDKEFDAYIMDTARNAPAGKK